MTGKVRRFILLGLVILAIVSVDQVTKVYIDTTMTLHESIPIIPGYFNLTYIPNAAPGFRI